MVTPYWPTWRCCATASTRERGNADHHGGAPALAHAQSALVAPTPERGGGRAPWRALERAGLAALYMSEAFATAVAEYEQELGIRPGTLCAYDVEAEDIVDLTDAPTLTVLRSSRLLCSVLGSRSHLSRSGDRRPGIWPIGCSGWP